MLRSEFSQLNCALIALGTVLIAMLARAAINFEFDEQIPFTTFYPAVMLTAICCGLRWGIVSTVMSGIAASFWLVPLGKPLIERPHDLPSMGLFLIVALMIVVLTNRVRGHRIEAERATEERQILLEREHAARIEAERANKAKNDFLAAITHELRTPLQSILGWIELMRMGELDESQLELGIGSIERSAKIQSQLVSDLLDTSRILMGKLRLDTRPIFLSDVLQDAMATVAPAAAAKGIRLVCDAPAATGGVLGDPDRLHQVVWNLLSNAIKFTPEGGEVTASLSCRAQRVELTVVDTGPGIDAQFVEKVFVRFQQAELGQQAGGLGLGLSIVRDLIELHGGVVNAGARTPGPGAQFTVSLPSFTVAPPAITNDRDGDLRTCTSPAPQALAGKRVLVVEDDPSAAQAIRTVLELRGAEVVTAGSAREASGALASRQLDAMVSDIGMPVEDGLQLIRNVRRLAEPRRSRIPAIALSGRTRGEDRKQAISAGFETHLAKPVTAEELVETLAKLTAIK